MSSEQLPEHRDGPDSANRDDAKRKLAITLAVLTLVLVILFVVFFSWWQREGEETDEDPVSHWTLVRELNASGDDALVA